MADRLNAAGTKPPQGDKWTKSLIYNLKLRLNLIKQRPHNERPHTDQELKERLVELRGRGHTYQQIAAILNEQRWVPLKGKQFTEHSVVQLIRNCDERKHMTPKKYVEILLEKLAREHSPQSPDDEFRRPGFPKLAKLLGEAGYLTPKGNPHWWPAQVQQLLEGHFDRYYARQ